MYACINLYLCVVYTYYLLVVYIYIYIYNETKLCVCVFEALNLKLEYLGWSQSECLTAMKL